MKNRRQRIRQRRQNCRTILFAVSSPTVGDECEKPTHQVSVILGSGIQCGDSHIKWTISHGAKKFKVCCTLA